MGVEATLEVDCEGTVDFTLDFEETAGFFALAAMRLEGRARLAALRTRNPRLEIA